MYIINDTYFYSPKYEIPNLEESDSKAFSQLERLIDDRCRLFMQSILTDDEFVDFESYLVGGIFPIVTTGIPQKWIDLINGKENWKGLIYTNGTNKGSLLVDLVYHDFLVENNTYITSFGDTKANPKGAVNVNSTQRIVNVWNDFVSKYQGNCIPYYKYDNFYSSNIYFDNSLISFMQKEFEFKPIKLYQVKNQLGL